MPFPGFITHNVPGRIRLKFPTAKGHSEFLSTTAHEFAKLPQVRDVRINSLTGSILILHDDSDHLKFVEALTGIPEYGYRFTLELGNDSAGSPPIPVNQNGSHGRSLIASAIFDAARTWNSQIRQATDNKLDLAVLVPLVAAAMALSKRSSAQGTPIWVTLGMFAFQSFLSLNGTPGQATGNSQDAQVKAATNRSAAARSDEAKGMIPESSGEL